MLAVFFILAAYAVALVAAHRRWRWYGPLGLALAVALLAAAWGTVEWRRPHTDPVQLTSFDDWQCHSLTVIPALLVFTGVGLVALRLVRSLPSTWRTQLLAVIVSFAVAFYPAAFLQLYVGVQLWACDTL